MESDGRRSAEAQDGMSDTKFLAVYEKLRKLDEQQVMFVLRLCFMRLIELRVEAAKLKETTT